MGNPLKLGFGLRSLDLLGISACGAGSRGETGDRGDVPQFSRRDRNFKEIHGPVISNLAHSPRFVSSLSRQRK